MVMNVENVITSENITAVQLLQAVQLCDLSKVEELLQFLDNGDRTDIINSSFGPMQITVLEVNIA